MSLGNVIGSVAIDNLTETLHRSTIWIGNAAKSSNLIEISVSDFEYDPNGLRVGNTFVAKQAGTYKVTADFNDVTSAFLAIRVNGSAVTTNIVDDTSSINAHRQHVVVVLGVGDIVDFFDSGANANYRNCAISFEQQPIETVILPSAMPTDDQSASNYLDLGNVRLQWGIDNSNSDAAETFTFPVAFGATPVVQVSRVQANANNILAISSVSTTGFIIDRDASLGSPSPFNWFAIGTIA